MSFLGVLQAFLLGIIEGITEWLPVSSTGHIVLFNKFYSDANQMSEAFTGLFEYVIQLAAILAVVVVFWNRVFPLKKESVENGQSKIVWRKDVLSMWTKVIVACVPAVSAILLDKLFEKLSPTTETLIIASALIVYGGVFILIERFLKRETKVAEVAQLSYTYAFIIGAFQVLAVIPGTSRSGITIIGALLLGVSRTTAAEFTFFLAIPTMVGTSAYKLLTFLMDGNTVSGAELGYLAIGSIVAFAVSIFAVKLLMNFVKKHDFTLFGWYRIALGIVVIAVLVLPKWM